MPVDVKLVSNWLQKRLSRVTSSGHFVPEIDGLRFVAIGWVVAFHLCGFIEVRTGHATFNAFSWLCKQGRLGVPLFFVISGLILGLPFAKHYLHGAAQVKLRRYFLRRVTRLEPPYIAQLVIATALVTVAFVLGVAPHLTFIGVGDIIRHALTSAAYSHTLIYNQLNPVNWVLWSLEVEIQFYIAMPLLAFGYRIRSPLLRRTAWLVVILVSGLLANVTFASSYRYQHSVLGNLQYFTAGLLLADAYASGREYSVAKFCVWDIVSLPGWLVLPFLNGSRLGGVALPFAMMLAYAGALWGCGMRRVFQVAIVTTIGGMCYSIYLYHYLIMLTLGPVTMRLPRAEIVWFDQGVQYLSLTVGILVVSSLAFVLLERPFMTPDWTAQHFRRLGNRGSRLAHKTVGTKHVNAVVEGTDSAVNLLGHD